MIISKPDLKLPRQITPCPIIDANCEVRFEPLIPENRFLGAIYPKLMSFAGSPTALPNLELPAEVRNTDPRLRFAPTYKFAEFEFPIQVGPRSFGIGKQGEYAGWATFAPAIKRAFGALQDSGIAGKITRVGMRYINFFEDDVFTKIDLDIKFGGQTVTGSNQNFTVVLEDRCKHRIQIRKDVRANVGRPAGKRGSIIDIDSFQESHFKDFNEVHAFLETAHIDEKRIFFGLLKSDYLATLSPQY